MLRWWQINNLLTRNLDESLTNSITVNVEFTREIFALVSCPHWLFEIPGLNSDITCLAHSLPRAHISRGPGPPTCFENGWRLSCINTHTHWIFSLQLAGVLIWAAMSLRWRRRASVSNVFTQSQSVWRRGTSSFNAVGWGIKTAVTRPGRKGWVIHPDIALVESPSLTFKEFFLPTSRMSYKL